MLVKYHCNCRYARRAPAQNVSTRRNGPKPESRLILGRDRNILLRDRDETRDASVRNRDETETLRILSETRQRRDVSTFRDRLETETFSTETTSLLNPISNRISKLIIVTILRHPNKTDNFYHVSQFTSASFNWHNSENFSFVSHRAGYSVAVSIAHTYAINRVAGYSHRVT